MNTSACHRRLPRAGLDIIDDHATAFAALSLAINHPLRHETIVLLLDEARRGRTIVAVSGTHDPDSVVEVVECITQGIECEHLGAIVVASVRPPGAAATADRVTDHRGRDAGEGAAHDGDGAGGHDREVDGEVDGENEGENDRNGRDGDGRDDDGDVDRWLEMSEIASLAGVEVLEWFVIGATVTCPRDALGEPPRW